MVNAQRNLFDPNERDRIVAELIEDRVEDEWETIENLVFDYFNNTATTITQRFYDPFSITADDLPNILDRIISEGFQIGVSPQGTTINDFCDYLSDPVETSPFTFNAHNLLDESVDIHLKPKITEVLGMSSETLNSLCKKEIFRLYSCARVREDTEGWCEYIGNAVNDLTEDGVYIEPIEDVVIVNCE